MTEFPRLEDILADDSLFEGFETDDQLFNTKRYKRTVAATSQSSQRKRIRGSFESYQYLFDQVKSDIAQGLRQIKSFDDHSIQGDKISQDNPIKKGNFYVDNGVMLYVAKIYDPKTGQEVAESTNRDYKTHLVYENGTENHIWLLSLISSLYDRKRHGRFVTEKLSDLTMMGERAITTGFVYVVAYAGDDQRFLNMTNLYKIGYAKDVAKRLQGTENQATYLYAPVREVARFEVQNLDARKVETYIHHALADKQVSLSVSAPNGKMIEVTEWFIITIDEIKELVNQMVVAVIA